MSVPFVSGTFFDELCFINYGCTLFYENEMVAIMVYPYYTPENRESSAFTA